MLLAGDVDEYGNAVEGFLLIACHILIFDQCFIIRNYTLLALYVMHMFYVCKCTEEIET